MEVKVFEIRDRGTMIPALAVKIQFSVFDPERVGKLLWMAGYSSSGGCQILLMQLATGESNITPNDWDSPRTMPVAHEYIINNWDSLDDGDCIDVPDILGEGKLGTDL